MPNALSQQTLGRCRAAFEQCAEFTSLFFVAALRDRYDPNDALRVDLQALYEAVVLELLSPQSDADGAAPPPAGARGDGPTRPSVDPPAPLPTAGPCWSA